MLPSLEDMKRFLEPKSKKGITADREQIMLGNIINVMREFHYTVDDMRNMKLGSFFVIVEHLLKEQKESEKEQLKQKRQSKRGR